MHSHVEKTYKKVSQIQHVLLRPQVYIGSISESEQNMWVLDGEELVQKRVKYIPGLFKIFDEIIVNAADNYQRDKKMSKIQVHIGRQEVTVVNDGKAIPVQIHKVHKIYVPELIFGHLLTSSNYEDHEKRVTGGRNGYGAKLVNLFSTYFEVETADSLNKKMFKLSWSKNMTQMNEPIITPFAGSDYTRVSFRPDFQRFGVNNFSPDMLSLMKKRVYDMAGILKVKVYLNGSLVQVPNFKSYAKMYMEDANQTMAEFKTSNGRWQVYVCRSEGQFMQVSFVNGIATTKGGTHVNYIVDQIVDKIIVFLSKKKGPSIKPFQVKAHLMVFINCLIQNPSFDSQTKDNLTTRAKQFGSVCQISDEFMKQLLKSGIVERILSYIKLKQSNKIDKELKKVKKNRLIIPKLEDANEAGKSNNRCCLILTEGDSAKALALCGLEQLGRDYFGVFPLKGKPANVKMMSPKQVMQNAELSNIVKILGLAFEKEYTSTRQLRYSSVMIMADQDNDGSHIKGLVINFFQTFWPSLCRIDGFLKQFITPIIKVRKGNISLNFYSQVDYNKWKEENNPSGWTIKYYKGLGTSTSKEAKEYFSQLSEHQIRFSYRSEEDQRAISLAFDKKSADLRKEWLQSYDPEVGLDHRIKKVTIEDFINKQLIHFSNSDNIRSIPSVIDGLKPSQRKILFACFKRNLNSEMKVAQLAGYVAEHSAYHHGEMSLCNAIISMAQNYAGSNNLNLLEPLGQFGTRYQNGKDSASSRYIFTKLNPLTRYLFKEEDDHIVEYQQQENQTIEPIFYLPILPLVLINGSQGIGTGWSTSICPHKIADVIKLMKDKISGRESSIDIGWQNFQGTVERADPSNSSLFVLKGEFEVIDDTVTIRQIPINKSIRDYKSFLEQKLESIQNQDPDLEELKEYHQNNQIEFVIRFVDGKMPPESQLLKYLKLSSNYQLNNMHLFNSHRKITKFQNVQQIVGDFYEQRINGYRLRKRYLISKFQKENHILSNQIRFINQVIKGNLHFIQSKQEWIEKLREDGYDRYQELNRIQSTKNKEEDENEKNRDYNYLLTMPIWSFCQEKINDLTSVQAEIVTVIEYYQTISEQEMWLKDIEAFEEAWMAQQEGKEVKQQSRGGRNQLLGQNKKRKRDVQTEVIEEEVMPKSRRRQRDKNLMEEEIEKDEFSISARKKVKKQEVIQPLEQIKPLNLQLPERKEENPSKIDSILSKYLCQSTSKGGQLTLLQRIKARISGGDPIFDASYSQAKEQLKSNSKKEAKQMEKQEDLRDYLL